MSEHPQDQARLNDDGQQGRPRGEPGNHIPFSPPSGFPPRPFPSFPRPHFPPIPNPFPRLPDNRFLPGGCWLVNYQPLNSFSLPCDGTIRLEHASGISRASGDLYRRQVWQIPRPPPLPPISALSPPPRPQDGIPILPRDRYAHALHITDIPGAFVFGTSFRLDFEMWQFIGAESWSNDGGPLTATMSFLSPPPGYPGPYLEGDVKNSGGAVLGRLKMGWISTMYRKITIEIDTVGGVPMPLGNGARETWTSVFGAVGYEVTVHTGDTDVTKPGDDSYSDAEMHSAMLVRREPVDLNTTWHYHILAVKLIESTPRGIMYDAGFVDTDNTPREGLGIASEFVHTEDVWGEAKGVKWGSNEAAYFRTAVHELGHALGLEHNQADNGFMCTSDVIAGRPGGPFPKQIKWAFNDDDLKRLRHWPDIFIRPGGVPFGDAMRSNLPMTSTDMDVVVSGLKLEITPTLPEVPIGAPVRIDVKLTNTGHSTMQVPASVDLKSPFASCTVTAPFVTTGNVTPMTRCTDTNGLAELKAGDSITGSMTLLHGKEGPLFPTTGLYTVNVNLAWPSEGDFTSRAWSSCTVFITSTASGSHAGAAHEVLASHDAQVLLVAGGDSHRLTKGKQAIDAALHDDTLQKHFASIEARRVARRYKGREGDAKTAAHIMQSKDAVMSKGERKTLGKLGVKLN